MTSVVVAAALVGVGLVASNELRRAGDGPVVAGIPIGLSDFEPVRPGQVAGDARAAWPPAPDDASDQPLGMPPAPASGSGSYAFMGLVDGSSEPVRFDPCRPIRLVVNGSQAPELANVLLQESLAKVSAATGLKFVVEGATDEVPHTGRGPRDERYGNRWAPVLVAWTDPSVVPELGGRVAGVGGPAGAPYSTPAQQHWVSGVVLLDAPDLTAILAREEGHEQARAVIMHELAHLVGLGHVEDTGQLMAEENSGQRGFADGDLEGLRRLGGGPCIS